MKNIRNYFPDVLVEVTANWAFCLSICKLFKHNCSARDYDSINVDRERRVNRSQVGRRNYITDNHVNYVMNRYELDISKFKTISFLLNTKFNQIYRMTIKVISHKCFKQFLGMKYTNIDPKIALINDQSITCFIE